jgi:hypothetical protein
VKKAFKHSELAEKFLTSSTNMAQVLDRAGVRPIKTTSTGGRTYRVWGPDAVVAMMKWRVENPLADTPTYKHRVAAVEAALPTTPVAVARATETLPTLLSLFATNQRFVQDIHSRVVVMETMLRKLVTELGGLDNAPLAAFDDSTRARM